LKAEIFWAVKPCSVMVGYQRFGGPCCLHLQGEVNSHRLEDFISWGLKYVKLTVQSYSVNTMYYLGTSITL